MESSCKSFYILHCTIHSITALVIGSGKNKYFLFECWRTLFNSCSPSIVWASCIEMVQVHFSWPLGFLGYWAWDEKYRLFVVEVWKSKVRVMWGKTSHEHLSLILEWLNFWLSTYCNLFSRYNQHKNYSLFDTWILQGSDMGHQFFFFHIQVGQCLKNH